MPPDDDFLRAIQAAPDDDAPRLVFADWLDEHGQADRAAFIRAQIELSRLPDGDERRGELKQRAWGLLDRNRADWLGPYRGLVRRGRFRRGFVERITIGCSVSRRAIVPDLSSHHLSWLVFPRIDLDRCSRGRSPIAEWPESAARQNDLLFFAYSRGAAIVAVKWPIDYDLLRKCSFRLDREVRPYVADAEAIRRAIDSCYGAPGEYVLPID